MKVQSLLLDTGLAAAFLDGQDLEHDWAMRELCVFIGRIHTTKAVVRHLVPIVAPRRGWAVLFGRFLRSTKAVRHGFWRPSAVRITTALLEQYCGSWVDYANVALLLVANWISVFDILTLDRGGFAFFRAPGESSLG